MKCQAHVVRQYSRPGPCEQVKDVKIVRWAPTPLRTQVFRLCAPHRAYLERHGRMPCCPKLN